MQSKKKTYRKLLQLSLVVILILNLIIALFPLWLGSDIWNSIDNVAEFDVIYFTPVVYFETVLSFLLLFFLYRAQIDKEIGFLIAFSLANAASILFNGAKGGLFSIFSIPIIYFFLILLRKREIQANGNIFFIILLIWLVLPIIDCFTSDLYRQVLFFGELKDDSYFDAGFSGYACHKNVYAYICALAFLFLHYSNFRKIVKKTLSILLVLLFVLPLCKSVIVSIVVVLLYGKYLQSSRFKKISTKNKIIFTIVGIVSGIVFMSLSFFEDENRIHIITQFINIIGNNLLFGTGTSNVVYSLHGADTLPAHNFVLQGIADRGILAFVFYCLFLKTFFSKSTPVAKAFILFMVINGLFQPYFSIAIPNYFMMATFLLPCLIKPKKNEKNYKKITIISKKQKC